MTLDATLNTALSAVLANTWSVELPPESTWPAIVFEIESEPEGTWVKGAERWQHVVSIDIMSRTKSEASSYLPQVRAAMETVTGYMAEEESGDAEYEGRPGVYGKYINFRIRTTS